MKTDRQEDEWELSKENVQPLRQGRKINSLNAALKPHSGEQIARIKEEKHVFEAELRTYAGDDPIEVWYRYILWAEQTFPTGGRDSNLTTILERCVRQFKDDDRYRNDERYIYSWMKLADMCSDPLEIYNFMYDQNIGCELSCFYEGWAYLLEQLGNYKRADTVYQNGLQRGAKPYETLCHRHEDFQKRVARRIAEGGDDSATGSVDQEAEGQRRQVLSQLRTLGKQRQAPINRTGTSIRGSAGVLAGARPKTVQQVSGAIQIFSDENKEPSSLPPQTGQYSTIPKREITNKENEKKPGVWTKQKLSKPAVSIPISDAKSYQQPSFSVHVDENAEQELRTPAKMPEIGNQILSARKEDKNATSSYLRTFTDTQNRAERPMYCKEKIYCGAEEYSFEELRAVRWLKKQEQKKREEEEKAVQEMRERLERERLQLMEEAERVRQQRLRIQQEEAMMLEEAKRKRQQHHHEMERNWQIEIQRNQDILEKNIQSRLHEQAARPHQGLTSTSAAAKTQQSARQLMFDDGSHGNTENIPPDVLAQIQASSTKLPLQQHGPLNPSAGNQSLNRSNRTPTSFSNISGQQSGESFDKTLSGAPSPTVNTKEAMRLVMGMFNASLELDKPTPSEDIDMHEPTPVKTRPPTGGGLPFTVYDESQDQKKAATKPSIDPPKPSSMPFAVFQDDQESQKSQVSSRSVSSKSSLSHNNTTDATAAGQSAQSVTRPLFDDDIESHPRDDLTLAPVGSHLSFAAAAKFSSTPFNPNSSGGARMSPALDDSDIEMPEEVKPEPAKAVPMPAVSEPSSEKMDHEDYTNQTAANTSGNSFRKNLSPIMEGSSEDSGANSQSNKLHHTTLESHHSMLPKPLLPPVLDQSEDTMSLLQAVDDGNQSTHVIDTSAYIPPEMDEKTEHLLSMSICIVDPKDPFDSKEREKMLKSLKKPLHHYDTYSELEELMPDVKKGNILSLGFSDVYEVVEKIGEGGFAKIFLVEDIESDLCTRSIEADSARSNLVIKVEKPAQRWEFYICNELHNRLSKLNDPVDVRPAVMQIHNGFFFQNGSILVTEYQPHGNLLDLVNKCKKKNLQSDTMMQHLEPVMAYMAIELLHMVENIHKCQIIHGDIKPDNFLVLQFPRLPVSTDPLVVFGGTSRFVQLIDFGQSIDMTKYPGGTTFLTKVNTQCFQCIEMKTNRPWTYQTDLFGLAGTIHVLIFNQYMNVYLEGGNWKMTSKFARNWNTDLWKKLFDVLLNVPSCDELPDLSVIRKEFETYFLENLLQKYNTQCGSFNKTIVSK